MPQTQLYCAGRWREWDPKITTFPGLYLVGAALGRLAHAAQQLVLPLLLRGAAPTATPALCGTAALRGVSLLFAAACLPLFYHAAARLDATRSQQQLLLMVSEGGLLLWKRCAALFVCQGNQPGSHHSSAHRLILH
jgi:alpha-1,2-glucosyltransferase